MYFTELPEMGEGKKPVRKRPLLLEKHPGIQEVNTAYVVPLDKKHTYSPQFFLRKKVTFSPFNRQEKEQAFLRPLAQ